ARNRAFAEPVPAARSISPDRPDANACLPRCARYMWRGHRNSGTSDRAAVSTWQFHGGFDPACLRGIPWLGAQSNRLEFARSDGAFIVRARPPVAPRGGGANSRAREHSVVGHDP